MKLFEAAKSVSITEVFINLCGGTLDERRRNHLTQCPICGGGSNTPCFGLYGTSKSSLNRFKCFSCGKQGDSIVLVKETLGLASDIDAAKEICSTFKIEYEDTTPVPNKDYQDYVKTYNYLANLFSSCYNSSYNPNRNYFQDRGLSDKTIKDYRLGYCPNMFFLNDNTHISLRDILFKEGLPIVKGLCNEDSGECVFAGRYIFPITNSRGDVIAFSGRSLNPASPKYINTCDTAFFKKSFALFNFNKAKAFPSVYIVEGYMDALSLIEAGIPNVVAAMGTAFGETHLSILKGKEVILSLDHDGAGMTHMVNIVKNHKNVYFRVMYTPKEFKDFNDMLMAKADIKLYLSSFKCKTGPEFVIRYLTHVSDMSNLDVRADIWKQLASLIGTFQVPYDKKYPINTMYTPVEISYYWKLFSKFVKKNKPIKKTPEQKAQDVAQRKEINND